MRQMDTRLSVAVPLPQQYRIAEELHRQIAAGEFLPGDSLPSEASVARQFGVSRGTVRSALALLRADGLLTTARGRPAVVSPARLSQPLNPLASLLDHGDGTETRSFSVVEFSRRPASVEMAQALAITPGDTVYQLVRIESHRGKPVQLERTTLRQHVGELIHDIDLAEPGVQVLPETQRSAVRRCVQVLDVIPAAATDARLLHVPTGTVLLRIRRRCLGPADEPIVWTDGRYMAERVSFSIETASSAPGTETAVAHREAGVPLSAPAAGTRRTQATQDGGRDVPPPSS